MTIWTLTQHQDNPQNALLEGPLIKARCATGKNGFIDGQLGREGDMATPTGTYALRRIFYRPDKISLPVTRLKIDPLLPDMGWCDDPDHPSYNQLIWRPFAASHEKLWRDDDVYDLIVVLGHNDDPPIPNLGSAIFMHLARKDFAPTAGCAAMTCTDMIKFISLAHPDDQLRITARQ